MARSASSSVMTRPGPQRRLRIGKVISPGCGVTMASQMQPDWLAIVPDFACCQRAGHVVETFRFHRPDAQSWRAGLQRQRNAGCQPAAAAVDQHLRLLS